MSLTIILILTMLALVVCAYAPLSLSKSFHDAMTSDAQRQRLQNRHTNAIPDDEM